ncbi:anthrone oxygenase family protein [uncultured Roseovarius sp.]|uniref:anthrone oxygenase family protein n=1 Tax=uncultured Roseovarius sp. TaxID=293344 RepID=UPI0025F4333D|nr:anthrone oxygenase family protein [uncultured Roseovarius sp.]
MPTVSRPLQTFAALSLLLSAAIFGFFYAWVCSTMWGLDAIDPRVAITAMNGMNDSVRNIVFAPAFFGTPLVLAITAGLSFKTGHQSAATWFSLAALLYLVGAFLVTVTVNVPMNRALLATTVPEDIETARDIWRAYSSKWQVYNTLRTVVSAGVLGLTAMGIVRLVQAQVHAAAKT